MARKKAYNEEEVIEKAMGLFWRNGYEATSVRMLEKEMGINQFSIYSSFGSKQGVFLKSIECYMTRLQGIRDKLANTQKGVEGIKEFFYDFLEFSKDADRKKGCLVVNTISDLGENPDELIRKQVDMFSEYTRMLFKSVLEQDSSKDEATLEEQSNFLIIAMQGLATASRVFTRQQLEDYIAMTFKNL